jgi:DNA primase
LDLDLRDLQKSGRIGRIEVVNESKGGVSKGTIKIPSSLTRKETALLAATVETVTRVGPCESKINLVDIRDVRERKRKKIIARAAELLKQWDQKSMEPSEIEEKIDTDIKLGEIVSWGPDNLPAGPDVEQSPDLIIVEGRADVLNLLRIGVKNTVAVQGTHVPDSVIGLIKNKSTVTCFLDGDRGGTLILKEILQISQIDYVARAPEGYEVEELTRKQMIKALQNKKPISEADTEVEEEEKEEIREEVPEEKYTGKDAVLFKMLKELKVDDKDEIFETIKNIEIGQAVAFDNEINKIFDTHVSEVYEKIQDSEACDFLIFDGVLSKRLLGLALQKDIKFIACKNKDDEIRIPNRISVFYF